MKIAVLGKRGQVGWELQRALAPLGTVEAFGRQGTDGNVVDLRDEQRVREILSYSRPDVIINAAGYTSVDKAESEPAEANLVNAAGPAILASVAVGLDAWLVHYSTDYVFNGVGTTAWVETSPTDPLNVYGRTKLAGEAAIRDSGCRHLIFRTSWVYAARGANFVRTILRLADVRESLSVVDDQFGAPTSAELIADTTAHALRFTLASSAPSATYHLAAAGVTTWYRYAAFLLELLESAGLKKKLKATAVSAIRSNEYPSVARRPMNSRLDCSKLEETFGLHMPRWEIGVERVVQELINDGVQPLKKTGDPKCE